MHCGRVVPCGARGFVLTNSKVDVRDGVFNAISRSSCSMAMAVAMGMPSTKSVSLRRAIVCHHGEDGSSSRRISYKRRQQLPRPKGLFPVSTHETDVFEKNYHQQQQQERQKTRAFEFFCENDETRSLSDEGFDLPPRNHVSDGSWPSRILTQIQIDLMWWSLHSSSFRLPHSLSSFFNPLPKGIRRGQSRRQPKRIPKPYDFQGFEGRIEPQEGYGHARALTVAVDLQTREIPPRNKLQKQLQMLAHTTGRLGFFPWLERLKETYGASFMLLVVLGYGTQGFRCFPWLAMCYFFKDHLQVDPGMMQFLMSTTMLPMLAKPVYGIVSDSIYIQGAHRIPYLIVAGALQVVAWGAIVMHPGASSSVAVLTGVLTVSNMGAAISEVMNDALVAEAVKSKKGARQGELQSLAWLALATGGLVGNLMGGFALQRTDATTMFTIFMMLVGTQLLLCTTISERSFNLCNKSPQQQQQSTANKNVPSTISSQERAVLLPQMIKRISSRCGYPTAAAETLRSRGSRPVECVDVENIQAQPPLGMRGQLALLSEMLRRPAVYRPLLWFLSSYAVIPLLGSTMFFYQTQYLGLDSSVIGLVKVVGQTGLVAGSVLYNRKLKKVSLRKLFGGTQILLSLCMLSDIVLVNRLNLQIGIPDSHFVLGASAFVEAIAQFKILPFIVLLARLCPPGSEGSLLSFFMSAQCLAGLTSAYLGVGLASFLHISANHFEELPLGILIQAGFALLPVLWINFIPEENGAADSVKRLPEAISKDTGS